MKLFDFNRLMEAFNGFIETKVELWKLEAKEELGGLIAKMLVVMLVALGAVMTLLFFSLGLAYVFNDLLDSDILGFVVVGAFYAVITIGLYIKRGDIVESVVRKQNKEIDGISDEDGL
ncbi:phage holin family protein [Roseivirga echinicomitans]